MNGILKFNLYIKLKCFGLRHKLVGSKFRSMLSNSNSVVCLTMSFVEVMKQWRDISVPKLLCIVHKGLFDSLVSR